MGWFVILENGSFKHNTTQRHRKLGSVLRVAECFHNLAHEYDNDR